MIYGGECVLGVFAGETWKGDAGKVMHIKVML